MAFSALTTAEVQAGEPVKQSLQTKIKDNFDDHEDRITANAVSLDNKYGGSMFNVGAAYSAAADALTITLKQQDGSTDPTAGSPARVAVRSASATSATYAIIDVESGISLTIPKGATLGGTNAVLTRYYLYLMSNAGVGELAVSGTEYHVSDIATTAAISAASDATGTMYSTTARTNLPITPIGYFEVTTSTSGDWVAPSKVFIGNTTDTTDMGIFSGGILTDHASANTNMQELSDAIESNDTDISNLKNSGGGLAVLGTGLNNSSWTTLTEDTVYAPSGKIHVTGFIDANYSKIAGGSLHFRYVIDTSTAATTSYYASGSIPNGGSLDVPMGGYWSTTAGTHSVKLQYYVDTAGALTAGNFSSICTIAGS